MIPEHNEKEPKLEEEERRDLGSYDLLSSTRDEEEKKDELGSSTDLPPNQADSFFVNRESSEIELDDFEGEEIPTSDALQNKI